MPLLAVTLQGSETQIQAQARFSEMRNVSVLGILTDSLPY
jgi:hypothetical protein